MVGVDEALCFVFQVGTELGTKCPVGEPRHRLDGGLRLRRNLARKRLYPFVECFIIDHPVDHAESKGRRRVERSAGVEQPLGQRRADLAGKKYDSSGARPCAPLDFRQGQHGAAGSDAVAASQCQLESSAHACVTDGGDGRHVEFDQGEDHLVRVMHMRAGNRGVEAL